jgi:hypothetical protein
VFDPRKLTTTFLPGAHELGPPPPAPRRYTLTHNDLTGQLALSIGGCYNAAQVSGWYTRLIRCALQPDQGVLTVMVLVQIRCADGDGDCAVCLDGAFGMALVLLLLFECIENACDVKGFNVARAHKQGLRSWQNDS